MRSIEWLCCRWSDDLGWPLTNLTTSISTLCVALCVFLISDRKYKIWCTCWMCKSQLTDDKPLLVLGGGHVMWPIFWGSNHITGTAEPNKVVKFCTQVDYINSSNRITYHILKGRGYGHVTVLKFCHLPWCTASRVFVSDSWATCLHSGLLL